MVNQVNKNQQGAVYNTPQTKLDSQKTQTANLDAKSANTALKQASDSVSLTAQASQLTALQEKAQKSSGFDQNKVAELKKAIADGKYQVDSQKLAKNIANFEFDIYG